MRRTMTEGGFMRIGVIFLLAFLLSGEIFAQQDSNKKDWTILVYLNADNNLEEFGFEDVQEMEQVGSNSHLNVVVQFDGLTKLGTQRLYIERNLDQPESATAIKSPIIEEMPEQDMGNTQTLIDFVTWGMRHYPAEHYMLIMWNHGSGWSKKSDIATINKSISYDDTSGSHIRSNELSDALDRAVFESGNRLDIMAFDACLMAMFEVADSLSGIANYLVSSEETIPGKGYPYGDFLKVFNQDRPVTALQLARHLVKAYGESYAVGGSQASGNSGGYGGEYGDFYDGGYSQQPAQVTLSAIDLSQIELVKKRLNVWVDIMQSQKGLQMVEMKRAASRSVSFDENDYRDLGSYVKNILNESVESNKADQTATKSTSKFEPFGLVGASLILLKSIQSAVVAMYNSSRFDDATGISIFLPYSYYGCSAWAKCNGRSTSQRKEDYLELKWAKTSAWAKHLDLLFPDEPEEEELPVVQILPVGSEIPVVSNPEENFPEPQ